MDRTNWYPLDYLLLPTGQMHPHRINLAKRNSSLIDGYRFQTLDDLAAAIQRSIASAGYLNPGKQH
jgi:hypothetical protein